MFVAKGLFSPIFSSAQSYVDLLFIVFSLNIIQSQSYFKGYSYIICETWATQLVDTHGDTRRSERFGRRRREPRRDEHAQFTRRG